jgi:uncharacterized protein (DUF2336 family)
VALRADIPGDHIVQLLVSASHNVQVKLEAAHPSMANMRQATVAEAAAAILDETGTSSRNYTVARERISSLHSAGQLGEEQLAAFAAAGQFKEGAAALAILCGLSINVVDRALAQDRPDAVLVMGKAIGMSWPTSLYCGRVRVSAAFRPANPKSANARSPA